jgi:hypothetical protein
MQCERLECRKLLAADFWSNEYVPGEVLVQYSADATPAQRAESRALVAGLVSESIQTVTMKQQGSGQLDRISIGRGLGVQDAISQLKQRPWVIYAEPNYIYRAAAVSNDAYYTNGSLWGVYGDDLPTASGPSNTTNQFGSHAEKAWNAGITGSASVVVGIIDEGVQITHPDLKNNIWVNPYETPGDGIDNDGNGYIDDMNGWDFVYNDAGVYNAGEDAHGTHVAGTIGGEGNNGIGVAGVNWDVTMISTKFLGPSGGTTANAIKAVDYLTDIKTRHGINLVASNNSWGGGGYSQALHDAIIRGAKANILFVAAAGNSTSNNDTGGYYPSSYNTSVGTSTQTAASYDAVIAVASITNTGAISSFSSYGATTVDIGAPGSGIWSSVPTDTYASYNGTSMATPHVTGAIALYASAQSGSVSAATIRNDILASATPTASLVGKTVTGGRLNAYEAIMRSTGVTLDKNLYSGTGTVSITVNHPGANLNSTAADTIQVTVRSTTETVAEVVTLTETGVSTGRFVGSIGLGSGAVIADGILQVNHNDTITVTYAALNKTATALVDSVAPTITNISSIPKANSSEIRWTTNENSSTEVLYGTTSTNLDRTFTKNEAVLSHSAVLGNLSPNTVYFYRVISRDIVGNVSQSSVGSFTTTAPSAILFVDDDQGATFDRFYKTALTANGYSYDVWDAFSAGATPTTNDLRNYQLVVWNTGYDYASATAGLSAGEQTAIAGYLDGGGRIFISGQDILYNGVTAAFQQNYLKVASFTSDVSSAVHTETGVAGNAISAGLSLAMTKPSDFPSIYTDGLTPVAGAEGTLLHNVAGATNIYSTVNFRGNYSAGGFGVVFMTTPFESLSTTAAAPNNQNEFLKRVVTYLNSTVGVTVSSPSSVSTTEAGGTVTFTVKLNSAPTADVTIPVVSSDTTEGIVSPSSLVFTSANWNTPQTVTVTGVDDLIDDSNVAYQVRLDAITSTDSNYNGLNPSDVNLTNVDNDTAGFITATPSGNVTTEAGGTATVTVRLASEPTADVVIPISSSDTTEGSVTVTSLTFTTANWNVAQSVVVTGVNDNLDDNNIAYNLVLGSASSSDATYNGLNPADVGLVNTDDDTAGITVSSPSGVTTTEAGGKVTFTVRLNSQPTANVTIPVSSSDTTEGTVDVTSLVFTATDWDVAKTVTVTGVNDGLDDGDIAYNAVLGAASSTDSVYNGINPADISLTNVDDDASGIVVSAPSVAATTEAGGQATFTVRLASQPTANVTIGVSSNDTTEATVNVSSLVFTSANWSTPQTVTVTGVNDSLDDGTIAYLVVLAAASSTDTNYNGVNPLDVALENNDDDVSGVTVGTPSGTTTTEAGGQVTFTVRLNAEPTATVTVPVSSSDQTEATVSAASLVFTAANWNTPQTITVRGVNDNVDDGNINFNVVLGAVSSTDILYNGIDPADIGLVNQDDDTAGITVSSPSGTSTTEAGGSITFTVRLNSEPTGNVTVPLSSSDTTEGAVNVASLVFTPVNWNTNQTVTVQGVDDTIVDGNIVYSAIIGSATSADTLYSGINPADISLTNLDNDTNLVTKFYVVNDGTVDRTFEYTETGTAVENYAVNSANTASRGIASTAAGDKVWVVDNNRKVYVYSTSGVLLSSWTASGFVSNALIEGIATDGTHVWIVDSRADRVYYFANAAALNNVTRTATSSFLLNSANRSPKDIVTDGVSLWVVNSSSTDVVFKYTIAGALQSSWSLNTANSNPTGIALDPANGSMDIWVVDNGTDRVYRYTNGRTATAPVLASSFALSATNTNPQGIADPPVVDPIGSEIYVTPSNAKSGKSSADLRMSGGVVMTPSIRFESVGREQSATELRSAAGKNANPQAIDRYFGSRGERAGDDSSRSLYRQGARASGNPKAGPVTGGSLKSKSSVHEAHDVVFGDIDHL